MKVQEVVQFANEDDPERVLCPDSDTAVEENPNAEVEYSILNVTTDEIEILLWFFDGESKKKEYLGVVSGSYAFMLLHEFGIEFPDTY